MVEKSSEEGEKGRKGAGFIYITKSEEF